MKVSRQGSFVEVHYTRDDAREFADHWPCSTVRGSGSFTFTESGCLEDSSGSAGAGTGEDWLAFSHDCWQYALDALDALDTAKRKGRKPRMVDKSTQESRDGDQLEGLMEPTPLSLDDVPVGTIVYAATDDDHWYEFDNRPETADEPLDDWWLSSAYVVVELDICKKDGDSHRKKCAIPLLGVAFTGEISSDVRMRVWTTLIVYRTFAEAMQAMAVHAVKYKQKCDLAARDIRAFAVRIIEEGFGLPAAYVNNRPGAVKETDQCPSNHP